MESSPEFPRVDDIISQTEHILDQVAERTVEVLRPFVARQSDDGEIFACFELFHEQDYAMGYNKFFPKQAGGLNDLEVVWGPMDASGESFLPELRDFEEALLDAIELTQEESAAWTEKSEALLIKWFSACWISAGGQDSAIPTYFCLEKEYQCRDMETGEVLSEQEAARRAGYAVE